MCGRAVPLLRTEGPWDPVGSWLGPQASSSVSQRRQGRSWLTRRAPSKVECVRLT